MRLRLRLAFASSILGLLGSCLTQVQDLESKSDAGTADAATTGGSGGITGGFGGTGGTTAGAGGTGGSDASLDGSADAADSSDAKTGPVGLIGYWPLDEKTGWVAKDMIGNQDGIVPTSASWSTDAAKGGALHFSKGSPLTIAGWSSPQFPSKGTLSFWFKPEFNSNGVEATNRDLFDTWDKTRRHIFVRRPISDMAPPKVQITIQRIDSGYLSNVYFPSSGKKWQHLAVGWDASTGKALLYFNGQTQPIDFAKQNPIGSPTVNNSSLGTTTSGSWTKSDFTIECWQKLSSPKSAL